MHASAMPPRLDHEFFGEELRPHLGAVLLKRGPGGDSRHPCRTGRVRRGRGQRRATGLAGSDERVPAMSDREILEIEISPAHVLDAFVEYLHRLGCSVESRGNGRLIAFVTF